MADIISTKAKPVVSVSKIPNLKVAAKYGATICEFDHNFRSAFIMRRGTEPSRGWQTAVDVEPLAIVDETVAGAAARLEADKFLATINESNRPGLTAQSTSGRTILSTHLSRTSQVQVKLGTDARRAFGQEGRELCL